MKRIIEKLLKLVHTILSHYGFTSGTPSVSHRSTPPPSKLDSDQATQADGGEVTAEAIPSNDDECLGASESTSSLPDSSGAVEMDGPDILESDALAQEPHEECRHGGDDAVEEDAEESDKRKFTSINQVNNKPSEIEQPSEDVGSGIESDPTPYQPMKGVIGPSPVEPTDDNLSGTSGNPAVDGSTETTTESEPSVETDQNTPLTPQPLDGDTAISEDEGSSNGVDEPSTGDSIAEVESIEEESNRIDQSVSHSKSKGAVDEERTTLPRRPAPAEDASEYKVEVQDVSVVDQEYARWNNVVVEQLLLAKSPLEDVYLCVNPRILARVFDEAGFDSLTPEQAEQRFSIAVGSIYRKRVLGHNAHLHVLRRCSNDGFPDCAAFLAGSVLAAYRMHFDEEVSGIAYYKRLADLLDCNIQGSHPVGFNPRVFESLWVYLRNWLREEHGRQLAMPQGDVGLKRFVALPLAHVPLRSLDIEKLPSFFAWGGCQPGGRVRRDQLLADLRRWQHSKNVLTPTGARALSDGRADAVLAQVSAELESWDGSYFESSSRRSALVEIHFDIEQRSPVLSYLPRRPSGFPEVFDDGEHVFEASDEGWYDPAPIRPADGKLLESGFEWRSEINGTQYSLRRSETLVFALTPLSNYSGFLSSRRLLRGVKCSVLCQDRITGSVQEYLSDVAQQQVNAVTHPLLPNGWSIFRDFTARVHVEAPTGLEALEVDSNIELVISGGLRIGRRWSWIIGAPPQILVSGVEANDQVKVNGSSIDVGSNGELLINEVLAKPGKYLIEAGQMRRRIEVVSPQVSIREKDEQHDSIRNGQGVKIALPHGSWTLIGSSPDQIYYSPGGYFGGSLALCPFPPSWAIQVGACRGSSVAVFADPRPPQEMELLRLNRQSRNLIGQWANVIYAAHVRRPRFIGLDGMGLGEGVVAVWKRYAVAAKKIKRVLKRK